MKNIKIAFRVFSLSLLVLLSSCDKKQKGIRIAVASNFATTLDKVATDFIQETGIKVTIIPGSTGKLYTQIKNGAPYDIFLAADQERPELLVKEKIAENQFSYAIGQLALWNPGAEKSVDFSILESDIKHIAIANPKLAPYGRAAKELLVKLKLWEKVKHKIVLGENVSQALEFANSGNAEVALVSFSQVKKKPQKEVMIILQKYHTPITQDGCVINDSPEVQKFMEYLRKDTNMTILASGYLTPDVHKAITE